MILPQYCLSTISLNLFSDIFRELNSMWNRELFYTTVKRHNATDVWDLACMKYPDFFLWNNLQNSLLL